MRIARLAGIDLFTFIQLIIVIESMSGKIVVIGSSNTDMVIKSQKFPLPGETILGGEFFMFPGGKGANQAVSAARLGGQVTFVARTGNDIFGKQAIEQFTKERINIDFIQTDQKHPSGVALITVDATGENTIVVAAGANSQVSEQDIDEAMPAMQEAAVVLLQLEIPLAAVSYAIRRCNAYNNKIIVNPAPAQPLPQELYRYIHILTPNEREAEMLTGLPVKDESTAADAARAFRDKGIQTVIITLGARGAYLLSENFSGLISAPLVQAVDTTAAGDVFNGALAVAIAEGLPVSTAVEFANRAAAVSVTRMGAQSSSPYRSEVVFS
jgi:ribokinase